jgi:hypothetical protein
VEIEKILTVKEQVELVMFDAQIGLLGPRYEAALSDEQKRLSFELHRAEDWREYLLEEARWRAFLERLAAHFPGIAPALITVARHVRAGVDGACCCELPDGGIG